MASGGWIVCPGCGLRHSARTGGHCPRCGAASAAPEVDAPGAVWHPPPPPPASTTKTRGRTRGIRIVAGALVLGVLVAAVLLRVGAGPIVTKVLQWGDEIEREPIQRVEGSGWRFRVPPKRWYVSKRAYTDFNEGDGVSLERALVRPEGYAVAFLFATKTGPLGFDLDALTEEFSRAWAKKVQAYRMHGVGPLPGRGGTRVMHLFARVEGRELEALCGLYPNPPVLYSLVVGAPPRDFPALRAELEGLLASFELDTRPPVPAR